MLTIAHDGAPGRLRLKCGRLRGRGDLAERLRGGAESEALIDHLDVRATTGSVIVRFDPSTPRDAVLAAVERLLVESSRPPARQPETRKTRARRKPSAALDRTGTTARVVEDAPGRPEPWHALSRSAVSERIGGDRKLGLSQEEAQARLRRFGANAPPSQERVSQFALFARQFHGLPVGMLCASSAISLATGGVADAVATLGVVLVNGVLGFVTEGEAERRIHDLMDSSHQPARVVRDGELREIASRDLAPGDLIELLPGRQVPADARLVSAKRLAVDESALTGESVAVEKSPGAKVRPNAAIGDRKNMVFAGTIVAEGQGRALVLDTGPRTEAARIQMLSTKTGERPPAPVEAELEELGARLAKASLLACGVFLGVGVLRGYAMSVMLKDALALAVAAVPEGLPMVATSTLSHGIKRMEKRGILIRQISVVETLGELQTICLDKTGTLTQNRMSVEAAALGCEETDLDDPGLLATAEIAALNNDGDATGGAGSSPTERALSEFAVRAGVEVAAIRAERPRKRVAERTPGRPWMTTLHGGAERLLTVKGAPEAVLARSDRIQTRDGPRPLTPELRERVLQLNDRIASRPARVLGFASRPVAGRLRDGELLEPEGLVFHGLLGMADPIRPSAPDFIRAIHAAGIETVLITGDQVATATATARKLDLSNGKPLKVIDSSALSDLSPDLLRALARDTHVFARVSSQEKLLIVKALQSAGRVVAMTGDGVNDGPALNAADVGIAMGESGADLARDVANVVIRNDELETLVEAIAQGRSIYRNIRRSLEFLVTTNMSEIAVSIVEALHGPGEIETPMELLWINLATDVLPGLGLALADPDEDAMRRPPRHRDEGVIPRKDFERMGRDSAVIAAASLTAHFIGLAKHGPGPQMRGMTFLTLSLGQLLYTLVCQHTDPRKLQPDRLLENRTLDLMLLLSAGLAVAPFFFAPLRRLLGIERLAPVDAATALFLASVPLASVLARRGVEIVIDDLSHGGAIDVSPSDHCAASEQGAGPQLKEPS